MELAYLHTRPEQYARLKPNVRILLSKKTSVMKCLAMGNLWR